MTIETIKLFNRVSFPTQDHSTDERLISALNLEVATLGYTLAPETMAAMRTLGSAGFRSLRDILLGDLIKIKGADKTYTKLFNGFPYDVPDEHEYMQKRVVGYMASAFGIELGGNQLTPLSCGHVIDNALFNVDDFGACPICQQSVPELGSPQKARFAFKSVTPLTPITYSDNGFLSEANSLLARKSSLSEDEKTFLRTMTGRATELTAPDEVFRETLPFIYQTFGVEAATRVLKSATDVMRIASFVSDEKADLSLKSNTKYKLRTRQKNDMMVMLESIADRTSLAEDMMRNRERWLRLGYLLTPGSGRNRKRFPKTAAAFDALRNDPKGIITFGKSMEKGIRSKTVDNDFVRLMGERPGEFARKVDFMLRTAAQPRVVVTGFGLAVSKLPEKLLLELRKYLNSRNSFDQRLFFPKGQQNKVKIVEDKRAPLPLVETVKIIEKIDAELMSRYSAKPRLGTVWVDPLLKDVLLPFNTRGDSSKSTATLPKGSRFPFNGDILRAFVWWKNGDAGRVDVDLSAAYFDDGFAYAGQVSYTHLRDGDFIHSGDIQSAPDGASEFIDFNVTKVPNKARYLALNVYSYTGQTFDKFECFVGFMERDTVGSGQTYEPEAVRLKFDINSPNTTAMPLLFDLKERKVIIADIAGGKGRNTSIHNQSDKQKALTKAMFSLPDRKPTLYDIAFLNAMARGEIVDHREEADTVFSSEDALRLIEEGIV